MFVKSSGLEDINWLIKTQFFLVFLGAIVFLVMDKFSFCSFLVGSLLVTFNFLILTRKLPVLIRGVKGSVFLLLVNFYTRLLFTGIVLFVCIALIRLPIISLLIGLSTVIITVMVWAIRFVFFTYYKQKEA